MALSRKIQLFVFALVMPVFLWAQGTELSPEVAQLYGSAGKNLERGNYKDAITAYKQAIMLAPGEKKLYRMLGQAYFLAGNYAEAERTLGVVITATDYSADATCYRLQAAAMAAQRKYKQARAIISEGLEKFPDSGLLYHEQGEINLRDNKPEKALAAWLDGIEKAPAYPGNYYAAAGIYLQTDHVMWGLLYGEIYLNIAHDTAGYENLKNQLFAAYKTLFDNLVNKDVTKNTNLLKPSAVNSSEDAMQYTWLTVTPVAGDGITTENLVMARTRFLMEWSANYSNKYPYSLFRYWDTLVRTGHFEIYNEWLFGKAENVGEFKAWDTFHEGDIARLTEWMSHNPLIIANNDSRNSRQIKGLFNRRKR